LSQVVQAGPQPSPAETRPNPFRGAWILIVLAVALGWLYASILERLASQWWHDANFSHGPFVPLFSLYVLWQERDRLRALPRKPSWSGLVLLIFGLFVLAAGVVGAELFLSRISLLIILAGLVVLFFGWKHLRAAAFPFAFLLLMIPIPKIIFNQLTLPLQQFASITAAHVLPFLGVPVYREGNIINLPAMPLEVAEACSGIRSLMSLATLAIIYGYFMESRKWIRVALALASLPIAVAANAFRIVGTGLLVQYWDPDKAEGFFHAFSGWLIFVVSLGLLLVVHRILVWIDHWWDPASTAGTMPLRAPNPGASAEKNSVLDHTRGTHLYLRLACTLALLFATGLLLHRRAASEVVVSPAPLSTFPKQLGEWSSTDLPIEASTREVLGPGDFMLRHYEAGERPSIDLFIAYFPSQRVGDTMHSPQNCIPGSGWTVLRNHRIQLSVPGQAPFPVNEYVVARGGYRQLVLYWYLAHDRAVASEYSAKWYLVTDAMRMNRTDGSLVRVNTLIQSGESIEQALQRILPFTSQVVPLLNGYIPK
jgi:exosortase D (VPLPA-CTERM-specific)